MRCAAKNSSIFTHTRVFYFTRAFAFSLRFFALRTRIGLNKRARASKQLSTQTTHTVRVPTAHSYCHTHVVRNVCVCIRTEYMTLRCEIAAATLSIFIRPAALLCEHTSLTYTHPCMCFCVCYASYINSYITVVCAKARHMDI